MTDPVIATRKERIALEVLSCIDTNDVDKLKLYIEGNPQGCACTGPVDSEDLCRCRMTSRQVMSAVSYAALRRGKIVKLRSGLDFRS